MMIEHICAEPDIYRIEVPLPNNPLRYLNSYVVRGRDRFLVIDTGFNRPECREALFTGLDSLRVDLARTDLFLTHLHADHTGLVGDFARAGSRIFMHHDDYQYLVDSTDGSTWRYAEEKFMVEGMPPQDIKTQFSNQARKYSPDPSFTVQTVHDEERILLVRSFRSFIRRATQKACAACIYRTKKLYLPVTIFSLILRRIFNTGIICLMRWNGICRAWIRYMICLYGWPCRDIAKEIRLLPAVSMR